MRNKDKDIRLYDAVEQSDGSYMNSLGTILWYNEKGQRHREDGPAIILSYGRLLWFVNGTRYDSFDEWLEVGDISDEEKMLLKLRYA